MRLSVATPRPVVKRGLPIEFVHRTAGWNSGVVTCSGSTCPAGAAARWPRWGAMTVGRNSVC